MPNQTSLSLDRVFHALSDPTRRAIVHRLSRGPASVTELAKPFTLAMPSLLQHLRVLEASRLIRSEKTGRVRTCEMQPSALGLAEGWLGEQRALWEGRLDRMETYVATLQSKEKKHGKRRRT
ncbi:MAG TPA: metalloregulator ArsR/SmtB family transcription factor [Hyphomicrobiaceae bacterium]|nr:metalloregulator ArsR/SmtB family transcription factor [Hyphomicrobiaceae bacterium]